MTQRIPNTKQNAISSWFRESQHFSVGEDSQQMNKRKNFSFSLLRRVRWAGRQCNAFSVRTRDNWCCELAICRLASSSAKSFCWISHLRNKISFLSLTIPYSGIKRCRARYAIVFPSPSPYLFWLHFKRTQNIKFKDVQHAFKRILHIFFFHLLLVLSHRHLPDSFDVTPVRQTRQRSLLLAHSAVHRQHLASRIHKHFRIAYGFIDAFESTYFACDWNG